MQDEFTFPAPAAFLSLSFLAFAFRVLHGTKVVFSSSFSKHRPCTRKNFVGVNPSTGPTSNIEAMGANLREGESMMSIDSAAHMMDESQADELMSCWAKEVKRALGISQ